MTPTPLHTPRLLPALLATAALCGGLALGAPAHAAVVKVVDMGELSPGLGSEANAINNAGLSVGRAMSATDFSYHQVVWQGLKLREFSHCCSGFLPTMRSINLGGEVVGDHFATKDYSMPVYWTAAGVASYLPGLDTYGFGFANAINDAGQIAGASMDAQAGTHAVIWDRTHALQDLGFLGAPAPGFLPYAEAKGINSLGQVVGMGSVGAEMHAFSWLNGSYTDLGAGAATHINNNGLIAGYAAGRIPVTWTAGVRKYLPALGGGKKAYGHLVNGINNAGDLVGYAPAPNPGVFTIAVLWRGGKLINLGHFPGGNHSYANGINDLGQIVGAGNLVPGGPIHALRWTLKNGVVTVQAE